MSTEPRQGEVLQPLNYRALPYPLPAHEQAKLINASGDPIALGLVEKELRGRYGVPVARPWILCKGSPDINACDLPEAV